MNWMINFLQKYIEPLAVKCSRNIYIQAASEGVMETVAITIIGSIFLLLGNFPYQPYIDWIASIGLADFFSLPAKVTIDLISLYTVFFIGRSFGKRKGQNATSVGLMALVCFFVVTPFTVIEYATFIPASYLGTGGLFTAFFVGLASASIYCAIAKRGWVIKLPSGVPEAVATSFSSLIPGTINVLIFLLISKGFAMSEFGSLNQMIYIVLQRNLMVFASSSLWACIVATLLTSLFWFFGIHGASVIGAIVGPIYYALQLENFAAYQAGTPMPNIITSAFVSVACGSIISLSIALFLVAKSKRYKTINKFTLPTVIFNVGEPILFGLPIVLNPIFFIPYLLISPILEIVTYLIISAGIVPIPNGAVVPWMTPIVIFGFLQGSWKLAALQVFNTALAVLMWLPFVKIADKAALAQELAEENEQLEETERQKVTENATV